MNIAYIEQRVIPALRSGEYKQTKGRLHDNIGFCCLGVMCDLRIKDGAIEPWIETNGSSILDLEDIQTSYAVSTLVPDFDENGVSTGKNVPVEEEFVLPQEVARFLGIDDEGAFYLNNGFRYGFKNGHQLETLVALNDKGFTFEAIADELEILIAKIRSGDVILEERQTDA